MGRTFSKPAYSMQQVAGSPCVHACHACGAIVRCVCSAALHGAFQAEALCAVLRPEGVQGLHEQGFLKALH